MKKEAVEAAVSVLSDAWQIGTELTELPEYCRPKTPAEGMRIQDALIADLAIPACGWKIACTSASARAMFKTDAPFAGRVFEPRIFPSGSRIHPQIYPSRMIEGEIALVLARDLKPRKRPYTAAQVKAAVRSAHPAIEIVHSRFTDSFTVGVASVVADNAAHAALVVGPAIPRWRTLDLAKLVVKLTVNGKKAGEGTGADAYGGPLEALAWLANHLSSRGGLKAGEIVTTGTCTGVYRAAAEDKITMSLGKHGKASMSFTPEKMT